MAAKRNFVLVESDGSEHGIFSGWSPRKAALKAANRCDGTPEKPARLMLRERGQKKMHIYDGWRAKVDAPKNRPDWLPDQIWKANVRKLGIA